MGAPGGLKTFSGGLWGLNYFIIILGHYLLFICSFSHEYIVEFSRGHVVYNDIALASNGMCFVFSRTF